MSTVETKRELATADWMDETDTEGQLAIDAYQTEDAVIIKAPLAGVRPEELEISITDEVITIKGQRTHEETVAQEHYYAQECYWGGFTRSWLVPVAIEPDKGQAALKNGILTIVVPKQAKSRTRVIKVKSEE